MEGLLEDGVPLLLVGDVLLSRLTVILESINFKLLKILLNVDRMLL